MKKHESVGLLHLFDVHCPKCQEWFRSESDMNEPPRHTHCRHCGQSLWDEHPGGDHEMEYDDSKYVGYLEIDLFHYQVKKFHMRNENE